MSFFSKVFEKVMYNHVIDFIDINNLLSKQQFGFSKYYSTNHAVIDKISAALDNGKAIVDCYIDLKKAFDTANHRILIANVQHYGICCRILDWFKSYLNDQKQFTHLNHTNLDLNSITCGVLQGPILLCSLYYIYRTSETFLI